MKIICTRTPKQKILLSTKQEFIHRVTLKTELLGEFNEDLLFEVDTANLDFSPLLSKMLDKLKC